VITGVLSGPAVRPSPRRDPRNATVSIGEAPEHGVEHFDHEAIDIARDAGVALPSAEAIRDLYDWAASSGQHDADIAAVTEPYRSPSTAVS
jgi:hypothetical protein